VSKPSLTDSISADITVLDKYLEELMGAEYSQTTDPNVVLMSSPAPNDCIESAVDDPVCLPDGKIDQDRGSTHWTTRLWGFDPDSGELRPAHNAALSTFMTDANAKREDEGFAGWRVSSVVGHSSPEGEEGYNMALAKKRAANTLKALDSQVSPTSSGETCAAGTTRDQYPWYRAVVIEIEFYGSQLEEDLARFEDCDPLAPTDLTERLRRVLPDITDPVTHCIAELLVKNPSADTRFLITGDLGGLAQATHDTFVETGKKVPSVYGKCDSKAAVAMILFEAADNKTPGDDPAFIAKLTKIRKEIGNEVGKLNSLNARANKGDFAGLGASGPWPWYGWAEIAQWTKDRMNRSDTLLSCFKGQWVDR
jgi:outer membrane protein OmpA-like peptidoglycan-associated protein